MTRRSPALRPQIGNSPRNLVRPTLMVRSAAFAPTGTIVFLCIGDVTHIQFLDDDCTLSPVFIGNAAKHYADCPKEIAAQTILVGREIASNGVTSWKYRMTFRGFYAPSSQAEIAPCKASVYPIEFFAVARWNESIFFGLEDADLSFQARRNGFAFDAKDDLTVNDLGCGASTLDDVREKDLTAEAWISAARLHVGLKRFLHYSWRPDLAAAFFVYCNFALLRQSVKLRSTKHFFEVYKRARLSSVARSPHALVR